MPVTRGIVLDIDRISREFSEEVGIEKPWAVYGWDMGAYGIGRIVQEKICSLGIIYSEKIGAPIQTWVEAQVHRFDNPVKAIAYFLVHKMKYFDLGYTKEKVINEFLENFPSEKSNLERLLVQRSPW